MLIEWFEKLAAGDGAAENAGQQKPAFCWPCALMGLIVFAALVALVSWILAGLAR